MPLSVRTLLAGAPSLALGLALAGCGGSPPDNLDGFRLGMSQEQVMAEARSRGDFTCRLQGTRPRLMTCDGPTPEGQLRIVVHDDATTYLGIRMEPSGSRPERTMRRFVRRFGDPAWRERPHPMPFDSAEAFHTLWLDRDTTRALAMMCEGVGLVPPCYAELARTSPAAVEAKLDTLLRIRR